MFGLGGLAAKIGLDMLWGRVKTNARNDWNALSPKVHLYIIGAIAAIILYFGHQWYAHRQLKKQYNAGYAQAQLDDAEKLRKANKRIEELSTQIANDERTKHDEAVTRIDAHADAIKLHGPGKAVCPSIPAAPGGYQARPGPVDAPVDRVSYPRWSDLLALPFNDTVGFAKQCDINADEVRRWHSWYDRLVAAWPKPKS